jgi:hypothetical protein
MDEAGLNGNAMSTTEEKFYKTVGNILCKPQKVIKSLSFRYHLLTGSSRWNIFTTSVFFGVLLITFHPN